MRTRFLVTLVLVLATAAAGSAAPPAAPRIEIDVEPKVATVGDRLEMTLTVFLPDGTKLEPKRIGPALGAFRVQEGAWEEEIGDGTPPRWNGVLSAFRPGDHEVPSIRLKLTGPDGEIEVATDPLIVSIRSILEEGGTAEAQPEISDLKPPASIRPDYGPLRAALVILALLLAGAAALWWVHRRFADRLAAVDKPADPFHATPPHVWVYAELQRLLERRLAEEGRIDEFYEELSRILKRYLGGRYRVDLREQTTGEVPAALEQAGAPAEAIRAGQRVLGASDRVKFAGERPGAEAWREAIEQVYRIVDTTKPVEPAGVGSERGAA